MDAIRIQPARRVAKHTYYDHSMPPALALRYWREFEGARTVLDVGCGTGEFGRNCPYPGVEVHGVDHDALAVEKASRWEHARIVHLDAAPLPYADATFDAVLAKDIFEHVDSPALLAQEIHRVLRPAGVLVASVVMAKPHRVWADYTHKRGFTRRAAVMLLQDTGLRVERVWKMGPVPLSARLGFIDKVPLLLEAPPFDALWGASWELRARK